MNTARHFFLVFSLIFSFQYAGAQDRSDLAPGEPGSGMIYEAIPGEPGSGMIYKAIPGEPGSGMIYKAIPGEPGSGMIASDPESTIKDSNEELRYIVEREGAIISNESSRYSDNIIGYSTDDLEPADITLKNGEKLQNCYVIRGDFEEEGLLKIICR